VALSLGQENINSRWAINTMEEKMSFTDDFVTVATTGTVEDMRYFMEDKKNGVI
jgi:hypothetical protein